MGTKQSVRTNKLAPLQVLIAFGLIFFTSTLFAGQWKPLCLQGSSCNLPYDVSLGITPGEHAPESGYDWYAYRPVQPEATGPLATNNGFLLHHTPYELPVLSEGNLNVRHVMLLSETGLRDVGGGFGSVSDANSIQLTSGKSLSFSLGTGIEWLTPDAEKTTFYLFDNPVQLNLSAITGPPVDIDNVLYIGFHFPNADQHIYASYDDGASWVARRSNISLGRDRFHLAANPESDALWGIKSDDGQAAAGLYESIDHGANFQRVDDGSFPRAAIRIYHDPDNLLTSYAVSDNGLFVSFNRGVSWQATSLSEAVNGMVFVRRNAPLTRALVVGTDTGVKVSVDEAQTWLNMSDGLLDIPHTVAYAHDMLIATSEAGYFTCNAVDCAGLSQTTANQQASELVNVVEYYNVNLKHYFLTSSEVEIQLIEDGMAGAGWERTGKGFLAWELGSNPAASNVCRFYGSLNPGPNSHFYSTSMHECRMLMNLQEAQPPTQPRWNFEQYAFSVIPPVEGIEQPCADGLIPVYRAYNNGYLKGEDSNHRYVTDRELFDPLIDAGWRDEGVVFCSPAQTD